MNDKNAADRGHDVLFDLASTQAGYFTAGQARALGLSPQLLSYHARAGGRFVRVRRGLYRWRFYPPSPREEVVAAWLAAGGERVAVSHESALDLLGLSDIIPDAIHLTVPRAMRYLRPVLGVRIHTSAEPLQPNEVVVCHGVRVTSPVRTILDATEAGAAPEQVERAAREAVARGLATQEELAAGARARGRRVAELVAGVVEGMTP